MDPDLAMAIGMVLAVFSLPAVLSAVSDRRAPRVAMFTILGAGGLILWALSNKPGGYSLSELPKLLIEVIARYI
ncbi:hypothetical protein SAMN04488077_103277 [Roseovarius tolerans]|jgi:hypothetical protein|uniref:50S ribosomal protein L35 n=1 Tax=Roseovarius tolerans TaxID=74031 RepID=A0A1H7X572_9RHOB|nr:hypothetical protein [Roseovarius tolerans]SEM28986.1 hypothetical protein SAMN04488077_103277 [Roseovarius tolerans]